MQCFLYSICFMIIFYRIVPAYRQRHFEDEMMMTNGDEDDEDDNSKNNDNDNDNKDK